MADMLHRVRISAAPDKVFPALTTEEGLKSWWTADVQAEPRLGSTATFGFGKAGYARMHVDQLTPPSRIAWTCTGDWPEWIGTTLLFELAPGADGGSELKFTHGGWATTEQTFRECNTTWGALMIRLKEYVETGKPRTYFA